MCHFYETRLESPLGRLVTIADETALYLLDFEGSEGVASKKRQFLAQGTLTEGICAPIEAVQKELEEYFAGKLTQFHAPLQLVGTAFQQRVWERLRQIPFGETLSYSGLAQAIGSAKACRAVAQANGANPFVILLPCHRVIQSNGALGGYSGELWRKKWLLNHEKNRPLSHV